jgi:hypothetical protein
MSEVAEVGGVNLDDALARLGRLLDEIEEVLDVLTPGRARKAARADVARARHRRLAVAAPEETAELERLTEELLESENGNGNGHGHG